MKCIEAEELIYLSKEIELSANKKFELEEHIKSCTKCAIEYQNAEKYFALFPGIRKTANDLEIESEIADNVIKAISNLPVNTAGPKKKKYFDFIFLPQIRYAVAIVLVFIVTAFFADEFAAFRQINKMEKKFAAYSNEQFMESSNISNTAGLFSSAQSVFELLNGERRFVDLPGDWMLVKKSDAFNALKNYKKYSNGEIYDSVIAGELKKYLNKEDFELIMRQHYEVKELIYRLMPGGENQNEN